MPPRVSDAAAGGAEPVEAEEAAELEQEGDEAPPPRRVAAKQRPRRSAGDPGCCQVVDCGAGLEGAPPYNRRYRICNDHYRASCTVVEGVPSRFCQQCGRFHELQAFDADCRSCRKELELHNKRRRRRAAALAAAGLQPTRGRKAGASGGGRAAPQPRGRAQEGAAPSHGDASAQQLQAAPPLYGMMLPRGPADFAPANIMEQVLGWSALSRGGAGALGGAHGGMGPSGGDGGSAAAHAAAANAGVAAALAAFAARHVGTGASIYGGGGGGGLPAIPGMPLQRGGVYQGEMDGGTAALLAAGWPGAAGVPGQGAGGLLGDMLLGLPPPFQQPSPPADGGAGAWGAGGA